MEQQPQMNVNIDLKNTEAVEHKNGKVWAQGFLIRKVSKFVTGTSEDAYMPIPVFYDPTTGEILQSTLPPELRDEEKQRGISVAK